MEMKISSKDFRVKEGDEVDLGKWPTKVEPVYKSKGHYQKLLEEHVVQLSSLQQLHYASDRYAVLLIFQAMDAAGKDGAIRHVVSGVNPQGCQPNCNTIFSGAPLVIYRSAGGSASSTDPITRRC
jgi:polyphosphate kinase 2 (PPK2 family)